jgi:16S rRNA processing protein RimM
MDSPIRIGVIVAAHGVAGDLLLLHELGRRSDFKGVEAFLVGNDPARLIPWFPVSVKPKSETESMLRLEGVENREKALSFLRKSVWIPESQARSLASKNAPLRLLDYHVIDRDRDLGPILEVVEMPTQALLRLEIEGKEVLIPLHPDNLLSIDHENRRVVMEIPDGLLDVYLS